MNKLDYTKITDIEFDGIDHEDHPDYCDAYIVNAKHNGIEMSEEEIEDAYDKGCYDEYEYHINNEPRKNSEDYYNETFNK